MRHAYRVSKSHREVLWVYMRIFLCSLFLGDLMDHFLSCISTQRAHRQPYTRNLEWTESAASPLTKYPSPRILTTTEVDLDWIPSLTDYLIPLIRPYFAVARLRQSQDDSACDGLGMFLNSDVVWRLRHGFACLPSQSGISSSGHGDVISYRVWIIISQCVT